MLLQMILLILGIFLLVKGADIFVDGASNLARNFKVSKIMIGLTVVTFGTSIPELAVGIQAMISKSGEIVVGNVIGSNILNILLVLGCCSLIHDLNVKNNTVKKELPMGLLITTVLIVLMSDQILNQQKNILTRGDGIILVLFFFVFIYYLISLLKNKIEEEVEQEEKILSMKQSILYTILGLMAVMLGSDFVVDNAVLLAKEFGVTERVISITIVALGTSLPELVTGILATKKKEFDIIIGNVVGSITFNIAIVLGIPIALFGEVSVQNFSSIDLGFLFLSAFALFVFSRNDYKIKKIEGVILLLLFIIYYTMIWI